MVSTVPLRLICYNLSTHGLTMTTYHYISTVLWSLTTSKTTLDERLDGFYRDQT